MSLARDIGLPGLLSEIAEVAGLEAALQIAEARGGNRVYIPERAPDNHWLVQTVGREAADAICAHFAVPSGIEIELPCGPVGRQGNYERRLHEMILAGKTSTEITRTLGISRRTVHRHRRRLRDGRGARTTIAQLDFFDC